MNKHGLLPRFAGLAVYLAALAVVGTGVGLRFGLWAGLVAPASLIWVDLFFNGLKRGDRTE